MTKLSSFKSSVVEKEKSLFNNLSEIKDKKDGSLDGARKNSSILKTIKETKKSVTIAST